MALPTSRTETAVAGAVVSSALANDLQDQVIALHEASDNHEQEVSLGPGSWVCDEDADWVLNQAGQYWDNNGSPGYIIADLPILVGHKLVSISVYVKDTNGTPDTVFSARIEEWNMTTGGAVAHKSDEVTSVGDGTVQAIVLTGLTTDTFSTGKVWQIYCRMSSGSAGGGRLFGASLKYVRA